MRGTVREPLLDEPNFWEYLLYNTKLQVLGVLLLCAFVGIGTPFIWARVWRVNVKCCDIEADLRYDCQPLRPHIARNKSECPVDSNECCWDKEAREDQIHCYYSDITTSKMPGYVTSNKFDGNALDISLDKFPTFLNINKSENVSRTASVIVNYYSTTHFSVKIGSKTPKEKIDLTNYLTLNSSELTPLPQRPNDLDASIEISDEKKEFSIIIRRNSTKKVLFSSGSFAPLIISDGFLEFTTLLPNDMIFGLGDSTSNTFKHNMSYPEEWKIFNKQYTRPNKNHTNSFSAQPFYLVLEGDGHAFGVLLLNSHPIQVITNSRPSITFRTIGGDFDFHFFMGPLPLDVIKQFTLVTRRPELPPYWALGFHMCRSTCDDNVVQAKGIIKQMRNFSIPFESDCGSALLSRVTFRPSFVHLKSFHTELRKDGYKAIVVHIPQKATFTDKQLASDSVAMHDMSQFYIEWKDFSLRYRNKTQYYGYYYNYQCPGYDNITVVFPNYYSPGAQSIFEKEINNFTIDGTPIDGVILDANTPIDLNYSRFGNRSCDLDAVKWDVYRYVDLNQNTPCMDLVVDENNTTLAAVHNLYGFQHMKLMKHSLSQSSRSFVLSLSTFVGMGALGGHWGGPVNASWDALRKTVVQTLNYNMYGMPLIGFPVCGFTGMPDDQELCLRWYQLAAMQPLMLTHRGYEQNLTDPISISNNDTRAIITSAITVRYFLLPYLYTLFYNAHVYGDMVVRPLFVEFPKDKKTFRIDKQYMWGSALLVSPVTAYGAKSVRAYFPNENEKENWYDYYSGHRVPTSKDNYQDLSAVESHINLHIRGGKIIPMHTIIGNNTRDTRNNSLTLLCALGVDKSAKGELFIDDGESVDSIDANNYIIAHFYATDNNVTIVSDKHNYQTNAKVNTTVDTIKIYGIIAPPMNYEVRLAINNEHAEVKYTEKNIQYNVRYGVLTFRELGLDFANADAFRLEWDYRQWKG